MTHFAAPDANLHLPHDDRRDEHGQTALDLAEGTGLPGGASGLHEGRAAVAALLRGRGASPGEDAEDLPSSRNFRGRVSGGGRNGRVGGR